MKFRQLKLQPLINFPNFLLPQSLVSSGDSGGGMVEYLAELDERHFGVRPGGVHDFAAEGLSHGMRTEVGNLESVPLLDFLEDNVDALCRIDLMLPG